MLRPGLLGLCALMLGAAGIGLPWRVYYSSHPGAAAVRIPTWGAYQCEAVLFALLLAVCGLIGIIRFSAGNRTWSAVLMLIFGSLSTLYGGTILTFFALDPRNDAGIGCYVLTAGALAALADGLLGFWHTGAEAGAATPSSGAPGIILAALAVVLVLLVIAFGVGVM